MKGVARKDYPEYGIMQGHIYDIEYTGVEYYVMELKSRKIFEDLDFIIVKDYEKPKFWTKLLKLIKLC